MADYKLEDCIMLIKLMLKWSGKLKAVQMRYAAEKGQYTVMNFKDHDDGSWLSTAAHHARME